VLEGGALSGGIPILDIQFGNIWTNIDWAMFEYLGMNPGDLATIWIYKGDDLVVNLNLTYVNTFAGVGQGEPLLYMNDIGKVALALNMDSFAQRFGIASGSEWKVRISKAAVGPAQP